MPSIPFPSLLHHSLKQLCIPHALPSPHSHTSFIPQVQCLPGTLKKSKHTHVCLHSQALPCSFSSIYRRPEKRAARAAGPFHLPLLMHKGDLQQFFSTLWGMAHLCGFRTAVQAVLRHVQLDINPLGCDRELWFG